MQDFTTGPLSRHLLKTTSFMLVMMVFQTLYFLIDLYWVGRLGTEAGVMLVLAIMCNVVPHALIGVFTQDAEVIAVGEEYLRIVGWTFVASGIIFVASSTFQAMGNTLPSLVTSATRIVLVAIPSMVLARRPDFQLHWIWYLSLGAVMVQLVLSMLLLRREFRRRLNFAAAAT